MMALHKQNFLNAQTNFNATLAAYTAATDFGNTDSLVRVIDTSSNNSTLAATLVLAAPYLSEKALKTVADSMRLTYAQMVSVLSATPDDVRDPAFLAYANNDYGFTPCRYDYAAGPWPRCPPRAPHRSRPWVPRRQRWPPKAIP